MSAKRGRDVPGPPGSGTGWTTTAVTWQPSKRPRFQSRFDAQYAAMAPANIVKRDPPFSGSTQPPPPPGQPGSTTYQKGVMWMPPPVVTYYGHKPNNMMKQGDWICPKCTAHNFASRSACFKCTERRPASAGLAKPFTVGGQAVGPSMGNFISPGSFGPGGSRPGDWNCPSCQTMCFASKTSCWKCNTMKPLGMLGSGAKEGDWECPYCRAICFAYRTQCFKCGAQKPVALGPAREVDRTCFDYLKGTCVRGIQCKFLHQLPSGGPLAANSPANLAGSTPQSQTQQPPAPPATATSELSGVNAANGDSTKTPAAVISKGPVATPRNP